MTRFLPLLDAAAAAAYLTFVLALFALSLVLPPPDPSRARRARERRGAGLLYFAVVVAGVLLLRLTGLLRPMWIVEHVRGLFLAANVWAFLLSAALFLGAPRPREGLRGFFLGEEKAPRWLGMDLKMFSYRPSLILLCIFNLSFAFAQVALFGRLFPRLLLYEIFTFLYVASYFAFEDQMRFTWDIQSEHFGWMLVWGDYAVVPFFYCLPGWFLIQRTDALHPLEAAVAIVLFVLGFTLFRGANGQKHRFKLDHAAQIWGRPAESIEGQLLVSGFWGIGRKLNYTGELCLYVSWTLLTGFRSFVPYLLPLWLGALLVHRAARDDRRCREKYGELWNAYCRRASFRMFPFVY